MKKPVLIAVTVIAAIIIGGSVTAAVYFYQQYRSVVTDTTQVEEIKNKEILRIIGKVMELPNEKPTIVTITDRERLQNQAFFHKAENGDKVIIFEAAKRVILYRPSAQKVIDVAPLVYNNPQETPGAMTEESLPSSVYDASASSSASQSSQEGEIPAETPVTTPTPADAP